MVSKSNDYNCTKQVYSKNTLAIIVHSGGTTGLPKGVELSNENLTYIAWAFKVNDAGFLPSHKYLFGIPPFHAFGLAMGLIFPLCRGMEIFLSPKFDEKTLLNIFSKNKINHIMCSGAIVPAFLANKKIQKMDLSHFIVFGMGGSPISSAQEQELNSFLKEHNSVSKANIGYGMSEVSSAVTVKLTRYFNNVGGVGIPLCKANVKVLDISSGEELTYGETGELCFSTPGLMLKYFQNEQETENAIITDNNGIKWVRTGDIGYIDTEGYIYVTGRRKRIYSTKSEENGMMFKIFPDYITNVIDEVENVKQSAVVCIEDPKLKNIAIAFVVLTKKTDKEATENSIREHLKSVLPSHAIPKHILFIDTIPLTAIGKPDYRTLEKIAEEIK